ncbi:MAG: patatin-like phospholipase family protein [Bacteroidales bacterium]|nr:patatin-like phospholipase family protein [Bacteroidales bacterium]
MKQPISLVLSGGAARGIAHIGVIEELEKQGFEIKSIAGNSMGAFIGAMYAMDKLQEYKKWILTLDKVEVFKLIDFTFSSQGLIKGDRVFNKMKTFFPDKNIEDLKIPYVAVAADITNMKEVVLTKGSIYDAVRASVSIPTIFTPVNKGNAILVDGGVVNPIPINRVKRIEGDILTASYVNANIPYDKPEISNEDEERKNSVYKQKIKEFRKKLNDILPKTSKEHLNYFTLINKSTSLLTHHLSLMNIEKYKPDMLINISRHSGGTFDFFKAEELIETGRQAARKSIEQYNKTMIDNQKDILT